MLLSTICTVHSSQRCMQLYNQCNAMMQLPNILVVLLLLGILIYFTFTGSNERAEKEILEYRSGYLKNVGIARADTSYFLGAILRHSDSSSVHPAVSYDRVLLHQFAYIHSI